MLLSWVLSGLDAGKFNDGQQLMFLNMVFTLFLNIPATVMYLFLDFFKHTDRHCIVSRVINCLICVCISVPFKEWSKVTEITSFHFYFYERCFIHTNPGRKMSKSPLRKHKWLLRTYYPVRSLSWYSSLWPSVWSLFLYLSNYFNK